ncbi:MAG: HAD family phosphatase [Ruminococcaceae bacterium]|nr:HAD family phosphatase [Oscillospiraceae bacterium]
MLKDCSSIVIYSDFDRTFKKNSEEGVLKNTEAIDLFKKMGGSFSFATGRGSDYFAGLMPNYKEVVNAPMVHYNGAYIYDLARNRVINHSYYDSEKIADYLISVKERYPELKFNVHLRECKLVSNPTIESVRGKEWIKSVVIGPSEIISDILLGEIRELYGNEFEITRSSNRCMEIMPKGINKGYAIDLVRDYYKNEFGEEKTIFAIGDYENDREMLLRADVSAAPSNASSNILQIAKIKVCHCDDGAIADLITRIIEENY